MDEILPISVVTILGALLIIARCVTIPPRERTLLFISYWACVAATFAQVWITAAAYGGGDMLLYALKGEIFAALIRTDPAQFIPELIKLLFHREANLPVRFGGFGSATGSMAALAGLITYATSGGIYTIGLVVAIAACLGRFALYDAFRSQLPESARMPTAIALMLLPSTVFWSSGYMKEPVAIAGFGYTVNGMYQLVQRRRPVGLVYMACGGILVALFKAYILFAFVIAAAPWVYFTLAPEASSRIRPTHIVVALAIAVGGVIALGKIFPEYALETLAEQAAYQQEVGQVHSGGSTYSMGNTEERTLWGQLSFAPWALATSLFRPFLYEVRNPQMFANAAETTAILLLFLYLLLRVRLKQLAQLIISSPLLMFCLIFTLTFGVAVGLTTSNLGTLSRYRMPLMPMFCTLLLTLQRETRRKQQPDALAELVGPARLGTSLNRTHG